MPFIQVNVTKTLSQEQKEAIKSGLGRVISLIAGKTERVLMVDISDGHTMYFDGSLRENCAYIDVKIYRQANFGEKKALTEAVFQLLKESIGLDEDNFYLSISEFDTWGTKGSLK